MEPLTGDGSGSGDGYGDGSGSGYGDGYGDGSGSGYGDGYGDGSGYGDGYGYRDGYGYGYGYGDGSSYWLALIDTFVTRMPQSCLERLAKVRDEAVLAYWRSDSDGTPCNGGSGDPAFAGKIEEIPGPLKICTKNALHATLAPHNYKGDKLWIVALFGEIEESNDKLGALRREIIGECIFDKS